MSGPANFADIYFQGMRDRSRRSGTELAREIPVTDWSTARKQGKVVLMVSTMPSLAQFISLFTTRKKSSFDRPNNTSFQVFLSRQNAENKFVLTNKFFLVTLIQFVACALRENLSNLSDLSSGVQIPRDVCTRFVRCFCTLRSAVG